MNTHVKLNFKACDISCHKGERSLFDKMSFALEQGEIIHLKGANGAGKTSLLKILSGLSQPEKGELLWCNKDIHEDSSSFRRSMIYLGHLNALKSALSVRENLKFYHSIQNSNERSIVDVIKEVGLYGYEDVAVSCLSAGQKRRVTLARLCLSAASIWLLDEPYVALDIKAVNWLNHLFKQHLNKGGMIILSSHQAVDLDILTKVVSIN